MTNFYFETIKNILIIILLIILVISILDFISLIESYKDINEQISNNFINNQSKQELEKKINYKIYDLEEQIKNSKVDHFNDNDLRVFSKIVYFYGFTILGLYTCVGILSFFIK